MGSFILCTLKPGKLMLLVRWCTVTIHTEYQLSKSLGNFHVTLNHTNVIISLKRLENMP